MEENLFSYFVFWNNPYNTLCLFALIMSFVSLWIYRSVWLWSSFLIVFTILGYHAGIFKLLGFIPLVLLAVIYWNLRNDFGGYRRAIWASLAIAVSTVLWFHLFPTFGHWKLSEAMQLSENSLPYTYWVHFDIPFIGIFPLAFTVPLICSREGAMRFIRQGLPLAILGAGILIGYCLYRQMMVWDVKFPLVVVSHVLTTLFLVIIPYEGFVRGFVQREVAKGLGGGFWGGLGAILIAALFGVVLHLYISLNFNYLIFIMISGLIYGTIYQYTKQIESSIICHALFAIAHFIFLTYPLEM